MIDQSTSNTADLNNRIAYLEKVLDITQNKLSSIVQDNVNTEILLDIERAKVAQLVSIIEAANQKNSPGEEALEGIEGAGTS